jgi:hypothetical protein
MGKYKVYWSDHDVFVLRRMLRQRRTMPDIALELERGLKAIRSKIQELGLSPKGARVTKARDKEPIDLSEDSAWLMECREANERFRQAMEANPTERPISLPESRQGYVRRVGMRFHSRPPSWSSMGDCE